MFNLSQPHRPWLWTCWSYTAHCRKEWSADKLLSHLFSQVFTIPPQDYKPSTRRIVNVWKWLEMRYLIYQDCHILFSKACAKAESSGREKGWRCVMFDRAMTRFYKGWPISLERYVSHVSSFCQCNIGLTTELFITSTSTRNHCTYTGMGSCITSDQTWLLDYTSWNMFLTKRKEAKMCS